MGRTCGVASGMSETRCGSVRSRTTRSPRLDGQRHDPSHFLQTARPLQHHHSSAVMPPTGSERARPTYISSERASPGLARPRPTSPDRQQLPLTVFLSP